MIVEPRLKPHSKFNVELVGDTSVIILAILAIIRHFLLYFDALWEETEVKTLLVMSFDVLISSLQLDCCTI
jgi:hypothetical protein